MLSKHKLGACKIYTCSILFIFWKKTLHTIKKWIQWIFIFMNLFQSQFIEMKNVLSLEFSIVILWLVLQLLTSVGTKMPYNCKLICTIERISSNFFNFDTYSVMLCFGDWKRMIYNFWRKKTTTTQFYDYIHIILNWCQWNWSHI